MSRLRGLPVLYGIVASLKPCEGEVCDIVICAQVWKCRPALSLWNGTIGNVRRSRPDTGVRLPEGGISVIPTFWLMLLLYWYRGRNVLIPARIAVINGHTTVLLYAPKRAWR